jgi:hypothetical protein
VRLFVSPTGFRALHGVRRLVVAFVAIATLGCEAAAPGLSTAHSASAEQQAEAQTFWNAFRAAVNRQDWNAVASMSASPLLVRGQVDSARAHRITAAKLPSALRDQFGKKVFSGLGKPERTVADWVRDTPSVGRQHWVSDDQFRVQNLAFRKGPAGWRLSTIYDEDE